MCPPMGFAYFSEIEYKYGTQAPIAALSFGVDGTGLPVTVCTGVSCREQSRLGEPMFYSMAALDGRWGTDGRPPFPC